MSLFAFFGAPGPIELIIIGLICLAFVGVIVVAVVIPLAVSKKNRSDMAANPNLFPCPDCGNWVSRQAPNCPKCGRALRPEDQS
ncbi:MAG: hypothetical protein ACYSWU_00410 [Planctomycetota bacterium]|jgi:predicted RNA-binding Zn-ribbon protein involved in translation (DUF1610 family)